MAGLSGFINELRKTVELALSTHERQHINWLTGRVTAVDTTNFLATVTLMGGTGTVQAKYGKKVANPAHPAVNDYVYLIGEGKNHVIVDIAGAL